MTGVLIQAGGRKSAAARYRGSKLTSFSHTRESGNPDGPSNSGWKLVPGLTIQRGTGLGVLDSGPYRTPCIIRFSLGASRVIATAAPIGNTTIIM